MSYRSRVSQNKDGQSLFNLWKSAKNLPQSQIAKTLQKSLCVRNKAEDLCWMPVVFWPSEDTASLIGMILSLTLLNGPRNTSRKPLSINTIRRAICRCQLKLYHAKRKPYVNMVQKCRHVLWVSKMEKCSMVRWVQIWHSCWKSWTQCPPLKRRETFQRVISFQFKSQHLWWCGVHTCIWYGQPTWFGRHYECWKLYEDFRTTYAPLQTTSISGGQCKTTDCIWCIIKWKIRQRWPQTLQQLETYIRKVWDQITAPKLQILKTSMPRRLQSVLKWRGDATQW